MYEELYAPIPDLPAYFARLDLPLPDPDAPLTRAFLDTLIHAHQTHISFEDLDPCYYHVPVTLSIPALFDKIITRKRGGYCFEMNALFARFLTDLGFNVRSVFCRIVNGRDYIPPCTHRGIIVELNGESLYCDVGYGGPQPPASVLLVPGAETVAYGEAFQIREFDPQWLILSRTDSGGVIRDVLHISPFGQTQQEFLPLNYHCSTNPEMVFTKTIMVNRRTETGNVNITGNTFVRNENGVRTEKTIGSFEEMREVLREEFFIEAP